MELTLPRHRPPPCLPTSIMPNGEQSPFYLEVQYEQFLQFKARSQLIRERGNQPII